MNRLSDYLYVGDFADAEDRNMLNENAIYTVVTLCDKESENTDVYRPLFDKKNEQERFDEAVDEALASVRNNERTLVHCAAGVSRSATVAATAYAVLEDCSFKEAMETVKRKHPKADPHPGLMVNAQKYLKSRQ